MLLNSMRDWVKGSDAGGEDIEPRYQAPALQTKHEEGRVAARRPRPLTRASWGPRAPHEWAIPLLRSGAARFRVEGAQPQAGRGDDQNFSDALMWLRDKGVVLWNWIVDETREVAVSAYGDTIKDALAAYAPRARIDCWRGESPSLILCESRSLVGVLRRIARRYLCLWGRKTRSGA